MLKLSSLCGRLTPLALAVVLLAAPAQVLAAQGPVAVIEADAPQLARPGSWPVGFRTLSLVQSGQLDPLTWNPATGTAVSADRRLEVDVWYPARKPGLLARTVAYRAGLPTEAPGVDAPFTIAGAAYRDLKPADGRHPLVLVSHGYSNDPSMMSWLAENLASKGYVVAAIRHRDPPITNPGAFVGPLMRRPLDLAFVAASLKARGGGSGDALGAVIDPDRVAAIGYSMGGYGVLTAAGAGLNPTGAPGLAVPGGLMRPYLRGGPRAADSAIPGLKAVVALAPAGGGAMNAWGAAGLSDLRTPLMIIAGDRDRTVGYADGPAALFAGAVNARRYMLVFENGGHSLGVGPAPETMRDSLWNLDWFEDPVWRKQRVMGANLHFITAFLGRYMMGDLAMDSYLDLPSERAEDGVWPASAAGAYDAVSPGTGGVTVWKGFQRNHARGLMLKSARPAG